MYQNNYSLFLKTDLLNNNPSPKKYPRYFNSFCLRKVLSICLIIVWPAAGVVCRCSTSASELRSVSASPSTTFVARESFSIVTLLRARRFSGRPLSFGTSTETDSLLCSFLRQRLRSRRRWRSTFSTTTNSLETRSSSAIEASRTSRRTTVKCRHCPVRATEEGVCKRWSTVAISLSPQSDWSSGLKLEQSDRGSGLKSELRNRVEVFFEEEEGVDVGPLGWISIFLLSCSTRNLPSFLPPTSKAESNWIGSLSTFLHPTSGLGAIRSLPDVAAWRVRPPKGWVEMSRTGSNVGHLKFGDVSSADSRFRDR